MNLAPSRSTGFGRNRLYSLLGNDRKSVKNSIVRHLRQVSRLTETPYRLNGASFFKRFVSAVFVDRLETPRCHADAHKFLQFRHPNSLASQIWRENARHHFRHVPAYAAFFLGQTTAMNDAAMHGTSSYDTRLARKYKSPDRPSEKTSHGNCIK